MLPAFRRASRNSRLTALVSGHAAKRRALAQTYKVAHTYSYDEYDACLSEVDAVYIALPNAMHAEYTIRAARAGVHVLCEKPMAVTVDECQMMLDTCREHRVKLMVAYRLHFEPITRAVASAVRQGRIGAPKLFNSTFSFTVREGNIRTMKSLGGGSLYDIGVYCIHAARHIFGAEPIEAVAISVAPSPKRMDAVEETTGALLRFEGGRVAAFVTSLNAASAGSYRLVGTKGDIFVKPAYTYSRGLAYKLTVNGKTARIRGARVDQFAAQLLHFSDCIRANRDPEPVWRGWIAGRAHCPGAAGVGCDRKDASRSRPLARNGILTGGDSDSRAPGIVGDPPGRRFRCYIAGGTQAFGDGRRVVQRWDDQVPFEQARLIVRGGWTRRPRIGGEMVVIPTSRHEERTRITPDRSVEAERRVIEVSRPIEIADVQMDVPHHRALRRTAPRAATGGFDHACDVEWVGGHHQFRARVPPRLAGSIRIHLDAEAVGVGEIQRFADQMIGHANTDTGSGDVLREPAERRAIRHQDREVEKAKRASKRSREIPRFS